MFENCMSKNPITWIPVISDVCEMLSAWHTAVMEKCKAFLWLQVVIISFSDSHTQQTGCAQKHLAVVVSMRMAFIAMGFSKSFPKKGWENCQFLQE